MDKFKMELTWHNCATCPPEEYFNSYLLVTDGFSMQEMIWDKYIGGFWSSDFHIDGRNLERYWWADLYQTIHKTKEFRK